MFDYKYIISLLLLILAIFCSTQPMANETSLDIVDLDKKISAMQSDFEYHCSDEKRLSLCQQVVDSTGKTLKALQSIPSPDMAMQARIIKLQLLQQTASKKSAKSNRQ